VGLHDGQVRRCRQCPLPPAPAPAACPQRSQPPHWEQNCPLRHPLACNPQSTCRILPPFAYVTVVLRDWIVRCSGCSQGCLEPIAVVLFHEGDGGYHHPHPGCYLHLRGPHATCHGRVHAGATVCGHFIVAFPLFILSFPHLGAPAISAPSVATATFSEGAVNGDCQDAARTQGGNPSNNSVATRGLPARTVVAAIPARSSVEPPNHVPSVLVPVKVRSQVAVPNQSASPQGSQNTIGNGSQQNSTSAVPQSAVVGVACIPSNWLQIRQSRFRHLHRTRQSRDLALPQTAELAT
jgi:hypothetical protein